MQVSQISESEYGEIAVFSSKKLKNYEIYRRKNENVYNVEKNRIDVKFIVEKRKIQ